MQVAWILKAFKQNIILNLLSIPHIILFWALIKHFSAQSIFIHDLTTCQEDGWGITELEEGFNQKPSYLSSIWFRVHHSASLILLFWIIIASFEPLPRCCLHLVDNEYDILIT